MKYRSEIDGLRAVAVVPVILFHAGLEGFEGGFLGVDVFFVISGYLITSILIAQIDEGRFSLADFYERRARRILPALAVVVLACIPFAEWLLLPQQRIDFWQSVGAVGLFGSNFLFWLEADYFAPAAELKPLLHTWSLAVEEQFYILFPLVLLSVWHTGWARTLVVVLALAGLSIAAMEYLLRVDPSANFYLPFSRGWELMAGAICALLQRRYGQWQSDILAGAGLLMVCASLLLFAENVPFPSLWGLIPVMGVCLLILFAAKGTAAARLLSFTPFVRIGLVSYSAYLWHQPLFAFYRAWSLVEPAIAEMLVLSFISISLAAVSYKLVEQPFRSRGSRARVGRAAMFRLSAGLLATTVVAAFLFSGTRSRDEGTATLLAGMEGVYGLAGKCGEGRLYQAECRTADEPEILVWGDSIAAHTIRMILSVEPDAKVQQATYYGCRPAIDAGPAQFGFATGRDPRKCLALNRDVMDLIQSDSSVEYVVIAAAYSALAADGATALTSSGTVAAGHEWYLAQMRQMTDMIKKAGRTPVFVEAPPRNGTDIGACALKARVRSAPTDQCDVLLSEASESWLIDKRLMDEVARFAAVIRPSEAMCGDNGRCAAVSGDGQSLYRDGMHFSEAGAAIVGSQLELMKQVRAADTKMAGAHPKERPAEFASGGTRG